MKIKLDEGEDFGKEETSKNECYTYGRTKKDCLYRT